MLTLYLAPLGDEFVLFNLFRFLTFRAGGAIFTALVVSFILGPPLIAWLKRKQPNGQPIREDGPKGHLAKAGTPTMGGFLILIAVTLSTLLWADITDRYVWVALLVTIGFGLIGFTDDYIKLTRARSKGLSSGVKLLLQIATQT